MPFLLDMKARQSHAEADISPSEYLIKETAVTGYGDCYFTIAKVFITHSCFLSCDTYKQRIHPLSKTSRYSTEYAADKRK